LSNQDWAFQAQPNPHLNGCSIPIQRFYMPFDDTARQEIARKRGLDWPMMLPILAFHRRRDKSG